jgi:tetratricopeptide (TPR) repeat protein
MESNINSTIDKKGQTITFYSYKGGVGRSMALVNIACLAAKENKKVLLIDCDLEAPGLHQFFKVNEQTQGFVDLIFDLNEWISTEDNNTEEGYCQFMAEHVDRYIEKNVNPIAPNTPSVNMNSPENINTGKTEFDTSVSVDLIKAGKFDSGYSKKLTAISWIDVYKKAPAFFRTFAYCLEKDYDYIFVDARTGLADTSGICTMLMPQKLVLVFALNNQNINGVVDVAAQAIDYRLSSNDYRELQVYPLPSRIENSANPFLQQWIDNYKGKFVKLFTEKYMLDECRLSPYFDRSFIQYYAIHAYGENIPTLYESAASSNFISYNYHNFLTVLKKNLPAWEVISLEEEVANEKLANEHFRKGLDLFYKKEYDNAVEVFTGAIDLKPGYTDAYFNRGLSKAFLKKYEEAILDFEKVTQLESNAVDAFTSIGDAMRSLNRPNEAIAFFNKAIEAKPDYADAYSGRANVKADLYLSEDALADYDKAIELKPDDADSYNNRGTVKAYLKLNEDALADYDKAISLKPDFVMAYYNKGILKKGQKLYEEALIDFDKAIVLKPDYADAYIFKGNVKYEMKLYDKALEDYNKAIELKPDYDLAFYNRGLAYESLKLYEDAVKDYNKTIELKPDFEDAKKSLELVKSLMDIKEKA